VVVWDEVAVNLLSLNLEGDGQRQTAMLADSESFRVVADFCAVLDFIHNEYGQEWVYFHSFIR
jgi:hypothetical protein